MLNVETEYIKRGCPFFVHKVNLRSTPQKGIGCKVVCKLLRQFFCLLFIFSETNSLVGSLFNNDDIAGVPLKIPLLKLRTRDIFQ